ncbi:hypothetical protein [Winogradskyella sediminis]|uniref:hypothetical protein n=1 Tax=Winogradskyella sediminis TaxID=1382466 RepID=UPI000E2577F2|nr:hypothetical protein [Winogradskyella sediminis]REG87680.1 hypothetical protein C8N41_102525 [Winogradskyella sediminis]
MGQDLRNLFKEDQKSQQTKMSKGHETRFLQKLEKEFPQQQRSTNRFRIFNMAASVVLLLGLSFGAYQYLYKPIAISDPVEVVDTEIKTLGDVSPSLKKVEDYYLASINLELSKVQLTPENKELFDGYVERLKELNDEYKKLTKELHANGPNEATLDALINNLKFRLNLVMRLKEKLKEFSDDSFIETNA